MKISFIGTGYVGLVTGAVCADYGYDVFCVDVNEERITDLKNGIMPFYEPGLEDLVKRNYQDNRLHFTVDYRDAVPDSQAVFVCVGTPPALDGSVKVDLSYLKAAAKSVAEHLKDYTVIVIKSTVPIGVEDELDTIIREHAPEGAEYEFASCPEFLKEGSAIEDTMHPDRLVFGVKSRRAADTLLDIHKYISGERVITDLRSAQLIKYAANSFLATKISFANGVANVAERLGADAKTVLYGMGLDKRIGHSFFNPGIGFGGSCFPKDIQAFEDISAANGYDFPILRGAFAMNSNQISVFIDKVRAINEGSIEGKTLTVLGLSFKPNTDDIREAPSLKIITSLADEGALINAYDPMAMMHVKRVLGKKYLEKVYFGIDAFDVLKDSDGLLLVTEWSIFKELDFSAVKDVMRTSNVVDGRNIYDPAELQAKGFRYVSMGNHEKYTF